MRPINSLLPRLNPGDEFPSIQQAWGQDSVAPGLLCTGGDLSIDTLKRAYQHTIFPWFSDGQPILWWSPNPRMVLNVADFRLHSSFKKTLKKFISKKGCEIRVDSAFNEVIRACATSPRSEQAGTWIVPEMIDAYTALYLAGHAHSIETWIDGRLVGGLYFVAIGQAVFGESMFHRVADGSKIALAGLVGLCRQFRIRQIDCQQNTQHLASLGAKEVLREVFARDVKKLATLFGPDWKSAPLHWDQTTSFNLQQRGSTTDIRT